MQFISLVFCLLVILFLFFPFSDNSSLTSEFSSLLSNTLTSSGFERSFGIAFVFTVETGFIPMSLAEHFDSTNSNIELAKMINCLPLNSFWHQNNNIFDAQLLMSNQLCHLIGVPNGDSLIITLSHSNLSKCTIFDNSICNSKTLSFSHLSIEFKNTVSFPIKCAILYTSIGQYPSLYGIPEELLIIIMIKLQSPDLFALMRCCKKMYNLAVNNSVIWRKLIECELMNPSEISHLIKYAGNLRLCFYKIKKAVCGRNTVEMIREF